MTEIIVFNIVNDIGIFSVAQDYTSFDSKKLTSE